MATRLRPFIPVQTQPAQIIQQLRLIADLAALDIGVFNPQQKISAKTTSKQPVVERGAGVADMQLAGGRWSKADARFLRIHES